MRPRQVPAYLPLYWMGIRCARTVGRRSGRRRWGNSTSLRATSIGATFKLTKAEINIGNQTVKAIFNLANAEVEFFDLAGKLGHRAFDLVDLNLLARRGRTSIT